MFSINYKYAYLYMYDCLKNQINTVINTVKNTVINTIKDYIILSKNKNKKSDDAFKVSDEHETNVI